MDKRIFWQELKAILSCLQILLNGIRLSTVNMEQSNKTNIYDVGWGPSRGENGEGKEKKSYSDQDV